MLESFRTCGVPDDVSITAVWAFCHRWFALFAFCYADLSEVRFGANPAACLTSALGNMVTKTLVFAALCGFWLMFLKSKRPEDAILFL